MEVDFLQPFLDIEAKTALANPGEVTMAQNLDIGIVEGETVEEVFQRFLLGWSASVGRNDTKMAIEQIDSFDSCNSCSNAITYSSAHRRS